MPEERDQNGERDRPAAALVRRALEEFEGPLTGYAVSFVRDMEAARDVVQDTFLRLYQQDPDAVEVKLKAWLFTVCRNRALDVLRKEKRLIAVESKTWEQVPADTADPSAAMERDEAHLEVMRLVDRLPANQQEVIRLKFQGDMSYKEISEVTRLSVSNVGFLLHKGIKRLRELMEQKEAAGDPVMVFTRQTEEAS